MAKADPILATILVHLLLGAGLLLADELIEDPEPPDPDLPGEIDFEPPDTRPRPKVERKVEIPETKPEETEPAETDPPDDPPERARRQPQRVARTETPTEQPRIEGVEQPAAGPDESADDPAPVFKLPTGEGGTMPVPVGRPPPRGPYGSGGDGTDRGQGGSGTETAGGSGPAPVSVATIKRRARPIGDTDFVDARKDYPPDAKRLGVEGAVKVRLVVDETGKVTNRKLLVKLGHGLDELAMKLARRLEFEPAIDTDDNPVTSVVVWTFHFTLPR